MFRILLFIAFSTLLTHTHAQEKKWHVGIEYNIGVSDRIFVNDGTVDDVLQRIIESTEKTRLGHEVGLLTSYAVSPRFDLQTGLKASFWGYKTEKKQLAFGWPEPNPIVSTQTKATNTFLELPIRGVYHLSAEPKSSSFMVIVGIAPTFHVRNKFVQINEYENRTEIIETSEDMLGKYRTFNMTAELGIAWQKMLSDKLRLRITPNFRMHALDLVEHAALNRKLFFYGLSGGLWL